MNIFGIISLEILIIILLAIIILVYAYKKGQESLIALILAGYVTIPIYSHLPYFTPSNPNQSAITFLVLYALIWFAIKKCINTNEFHSGTKKFLVNVLLSVSLFIFWLTVYYFVLPISSIYRIETDLLTSIQNFNYGVLLLIPLIIIYISRKF
jgi:hypothetical protein